VATFDQRQQVVITQYNIAQGISEEQYRRLAEELGVTQAALTSFLKILEQQLGPPEDLDHTLRQIATSYKDLQAELQSFLSDDPAVVALTSGPKLAKLPRGAISFQLLVFSIILLLLLSDIQCSMEQRRATA
jgi:hypothetical protein